MYEIEMNGKLTKTFESMNEMIEKIMVVHNDEYDNNMTIEERELKSWIDFYCGCDDLNDDDYVNDPNFFGFMKLKIDNG